MKNTTKLLGIIALVTMIGFVMAACGDDGGGGGVTLPPSIPVVNIPNTVVTDADRILGKSIPNEEETMLILPYLFQLIGNRNNYLSEKIRGLAHITGNPSGSFNFSDNSQDEFKEEIADYYSYISLNITAGNVSWSFSGANQDKGGESVNISNFTYDFKNDYDAYFEGIVVLNKSTKKNWSQTSVSESISLGYSTGIAFIAGDFYGIAQISVGFSKLNSENINGENYNFSTSGKVTIIDPTGAAAPLAFDIPEDDLYYWFSNGWLL